LSNKRKNQNKIRELILNELIKPMLRDLNLLDINNALHQMHAEYYIDEINEDPDIEFKARIDQFYDNDKEIQELLEKHIEFF